MSLNTEEKRIYKNIMKNVRQQFPNIRVEVSNCCGVSVSEDSRCIHCKENCEIVSDKEFYE